jgi:hypothetical protein
MYGPGQPNLLRQFPAHHTMATRDIDGCRSCSLVEECGHCRDALPPMLGPSDRGPTLETVTVRARVMSQRRYGRARQIAEATQAPLPSRLRDEPAPTRLQQGTAGDREV